MPFKTIYTTYGLSAMAAAEVSGIPINLTHMAVGDGGGGDVTPVEGMTSLVNQRYQAAINRVQQDPTNPVRFYVEMVIPYNVGGWTIREFGIKDGTGALFAVGNFPATYKTVPTDGATNDLVVRAEIIVSNAGVITIQIDPTVAVASQAWVLNSITMCHLLPGGTTGQIPRKASNTCGDVEWADPTDVNVVVDVVQEIQVVEANPQLTFNLVDCTTNGLTVHVGGALLPLRSGAGGWQEGVDETQVVVGTQYPIGTEVVFLQNEPANTLTEPLAQSLNLSDIPDKPQARINLDVYSRSESDEINPPGAVLPFARSAAPTGWLKANGALVSRSTYSRLFSAIGTAFGAGDGSTTFALPDLRGEFLRGWDDGRGVDSGRVFGSAQSGQFPSHTHGGVPLMTGDTDRGVGSSSLFSLDVDGSTAASGGTGNGSENRPRNIALLYCVRF